MRCSCCGRGAVGKEGYDKGAWRRLETAIQMKEDVMIHAAHVLWAFSEEHAQTAEVREKALAGLRAALNEAWQVAPTDQDGA